MRNLGSYVVTVYRRQADLVAGTVQDVRSGRTVPFQDMEELWQAIGRSPSGRASSSSRPQEPAGGEASRTPDKEQEE